MPAPRRALERGQEPARPPRRRALGRPAAAALHRPRARGAPGGAADGRALLGAGPHVDPADRGDGAGTVAAGDDRDRDAQHAAGAARQRRVRLLPGRRERAGQDRRDRHHGADVRRTGRSPHRRLRAGAVRLRRGLLIAALFAGLVLVPAGSASASGPTITGAGSTWGQSALDQWRADAARQGLSINYQGVGSTAGRQFFIIDQVDFAASEIPFLPDEVNQLRQKHKSYQYLPDVAGGTAIMYNLRDASGQQVKNLRLSATTIAKIFTGQITSWNDPAIKADNPGLALPSQHLQPVIRSDGSGTSAKLADYLAHEAPAIWNPFASANTVTLPVQFWPNWQGVFAVRGSDGMANYISNNSVGQGSIGYVEAGYVYEHSMVPAF